MLSTVLADGVTSNKQLWFLVLPHSDYYWMSHVIALREEAHVSSSLTLNPSSVGTDYRSQSLTSLVEVGPHTERIKYI